MIEVNAMGEACPIPVVKTLHALQELNGAGTVQTLDMWQRHFSETGGTAADIHASVNAMLNHAVALQSQVFSVDAFYLCTVIVGAAGVLFALLCLKSGKERNTAS